MNNPEQNARQQKKRYDKPKLRQVDLRPEEAVLGNCKVTGTSGPGGVGACVTVGACSSQGS
jgi:hypothetical protein